MFRTVLCRAGNGLFGMIGGRRTPNALSTVPSKSNVYRPPATSDDGPVARPEPRGVPGAGRIFRAVRGMTAIDCAALKPLVAPLAGTVARHDLRQPAVAAKSGPYRPPAASDDGPVATRSAADRAPPEPRGTPAVGRVFGAVRGVTALVGGPEPSAAAPPEPSAAAPPEPSAAARHVPPRPAVAVNGFGRLGKRLLRLAVKNNVHVVAINEPFVDIKSMARSFREDPVDGQFRGRVEVEEDNLRVNGELIKVRHEEHPERIKWGEMRVDYVIDSSGKFTDMAAATRHITPGGAKKAIIAAPSTDAPTFFKGVNYCDYDRTVSVASTGSSTASCAASLLHAMNEKFHVVSYMVSSAPIMTPGRFFLDATNHAEPAAGNVDFGAIPELHGTSDGLCFLKLYMSLRANASPNDIKCLVWKMATCSDDGAVSYRQDLGEFVFGAKYPISRYSAVVDFDHVHVDGKRITVAAWYDNATGRAARALDLVEHMTTVDRCRK